MVEDNYNSIKDDYSPVSQGVNSLGALILESSLKKGKSIEIPSLGIEIKPVDNLENKI
jgi:hypothetical protein